METGSGGCPSATSEAAPSSTSGYRTRSSTWSRRRSSPRGVAEGAEVVAGVVGAQEEEVPLAAGEDAEEGGAMVRGAGGEEPPSHSTSSPPSTYPAPTYVILLLAKLSVHKMSTVEAHSVFRKHIRESLQEIFCSHMYRY